MHIFLSNHRGARVRDVEDVRLDHVVLGENHIEGSGKDLADIMLLDEIRQVVEQVRQNALMSRQGSRTVLRR